MNKVLVMALGLLAAAGLTTGASAADGTTVEALLGQGYTVVAAIPSPIGPGLFLQKGATLVACFVAEKPDSPALTTTYCKPVH